MTIDRIPQAPSDRRPATGLVVVTGVCGFLGSHLAEQLLSHEGMRVLGVDRRKPDEDPRTSAIMAELQASPGFELVSSDVCDAALAARLKEAAAVVHLAASTDVAASWGSGFADQTASLLSSHHLLEGCANAQVQRFVVASSAHVYGQVVGPAREDMPVAPNSPYGVAKLASERLVMAFARRPGSTMSAVAVRLFTGFGTRVNPAMVVPRMFRSALTKQPMPLYGDGRVTHTWTHVDDLVDALTRAIGIPLEAGRAEVVNAAGADQASLRQVGDLIGQIVGSPVLWEPTGERPGDTAGLHADLAHAYRIMGFAPKVGLREGLESLWQTYATGPAPTGPGAVPGGRRTR